ncbi:sushi domain-containing protein 2-like isoform X2 [Acanthaster planci]|uniref:Sushi domain-containing protein 2-like isoform X2 n=1 Tax=Acanthaster planci TaxID=133434 RepID=A0A8B7Y9T8_ACAPL|nr:sushi domain-containing protein 2-like isoform X2 [Acanthaster planci]
MSTALMAAFLSGILVIILPTTYALEGLMFPHGVTEGDTFLPPNDDGSSGRVPISILFPFFDHNHDSLFVNTNGALSFLIEVSSFTPTPFPLDGDRRVVAPFWGDVDITHGGNVTYRELIRVPENDQLFAEVDSIVRKTFIDQSRFSATWIFIATWNKVPFFGAVNHDALNITNTFQTVLVTNGRHSYAIFNYEEINWTTGTASGGNNIGLQGTPAQVGFNAGDGFTFYVVPESRTNAIVDIDEDSNIGFRGRFLFRIDSSEIVNSGCNSGGTLAVFPFSGSMLGGDVIHLSGPCLDASSSIVCRFASVEVPGEVVSNTTVRCVSPQVFEVGRVPLKMSINGGEFFNFTGVFTYLSPEDTTPFVKRLNAAEWNELRALTITWDTELLQEYVDDVRISFYGYKENITSGTVDLQLVYSSSQVVPYNVGVFRFSRPPSPDGFKYTVGVVRVSQYGAQGQNELALPGMWSDVHNLHWLYPVPEPSAWCEDWLKEAQSDLEFLAVTQHCPCTLTQALVDAGRFSPHPLCNLDTPFSCELFKPGAVHCIRANTPSEMGGGQECCYGNNGNVLNVLRTPGGGFAQRRHHDGSAPYKVAGRVPYLSHWVSDILPMEHCCVYSEESCQLYKSVRPSQTCQGYTPLRPAITAGDPHLVTLDGVEYTFNGVGEYTMLETCNGSFVMQARMAVLQGVPATVLTALAAHDAGTSDQIQVEVSDRRGMDVWYRPEGNGSEWSMLDFEETQVRRVELEGATVFCHEVNNSGVMAKNILINFRCGVSLVVSTTSGLLNVFTTLQEELKGRTRGLYGNWNGDKNDDFERPNGTVLPISATMQDVHYGFGQAWQIKPEDSLFRYPRGKGPTDYSDETFTPVFLPPETAITEEAREICGNISQCIFDLAVTGDSDIARASGSTVSRYKAAVESASLVTCGSVSEPANGRKEVSRSNVGGVANFTCDDGYTLQGESELMCQKNGTWSADVPVCAPVICSSLDVPPNGAKEVSRSTLGGVASFTCDDGYTLRGESELTCQETGTWSGEVPTCEASGLQAWQIVLIVLGCCVLLVTVVVVVKVILLQRARK